VQLNLTHFGPLAACSTRAFRPSIKACSEGDGRSESWAAVSVRVELKIYVDGQFFLLSLPNCLWLAFGGMVGGESLSDGRRSQ